MSDFEEDDIEREIAAALACISDQDVAEDVDVDVDDAADSLLKLSDTDNIEDDIQNDADNDIFSEISSAFQEYYTGFQTNIERELEECQFESVPYDTYLDRCLSQIGINKEQYSESMELINNSEDNNDEETSTEMVSYRDNTPIEDTSHAIAQTPRRQENNQPSTEESINRPPSELNPALFSMVETGAAEKVDLNTLMTREKESANGASVVGPEETVDNTDPNESKPVEPYEMKIIQAWLETDKEIDKINNDRWDEYKAFMERLDDSKQSARTAWQDKMSEEIESIKAKQSAAFEEDKRQESLRVVEEAKVEQENESQLAKLSAELSIERENALALKKEVEIRETKRHNDAAIIIQTRFRGFRIRNRIGDDIAAVRAKARHKYQKDQIVRREKEIKKQKAKQFAKVRQQRDLETSRATTAASSTRMDSANSQPECRETSAGKNKKKPPTSASNKSSKTVQKKKPPQISETKEDSTIAEVTFPITTEDEEKTGVDSSNIFEDSPIILEEVATVPTVYKKTAYVLPMPKEPEPSLEVIQPSEFEDSESKVPHEKVNPSLEDMNEKADKDIKQDECNIEATVPEEINDCDVNNTDYFPVISETKFVKNNKKDEEEMENNISVNDHEEFTNNISNITDQEQGAITETLNLYIDPKTDKEHDTIIETIDSIVDTNKSLSPVSLTEPVIQSDFNKSNEISPTDISQNTDISSSSDVQINAANESNVTTEKSSITVLKTNKTFVIDKETKKEIPDNAVEQLLGIEINSPPPKNLLVHSLPASTTELCKSTTFVVETLACPIKVDTNDNNEEIQVVSDSLNCLETEQLQLNKEDEIKEPQSDIFEAISPPDEMQTIWNHWRTNASSTDSQKGDVSPPARTKRYPRSAKNLLNLEEIIAQKSLTNDQMVAKLSILVLSDTQGHSLVNLSDLCPALEVLVVRKCGMPTLEGLEHCSRLQYVDLEDNFISYIDMGKTAKAHLLHLNLSKNQLDSVHGLEACTNLRYLSVSNNKITRLAPRCLHSCQKTLQVIDLSRNQLVSTAGLHNFSHLQVLRLSENNLTELTELASLRSLRYLDLSKNSIKNIPELSNQPLLQHLDLDYNSISSLLPLTQFWLPNLTVVSVRDNSLCQIDANIPMPLLGILRLDNNQIINLPSLLKILSLFEYLQIVSLAGNPCVSAQNSKATVISKLPNITILNDEVIKDRQVIDVKVSSDRFVSTCLQFESSCARKDKKLQDRVSRLLKTARDNDYLSLAKLYRRYYDDMGHMTECHIKFQLTGDNRFPSPPPPPKASLEHATRQSSQQPSSSVADREEKVAMKDQPIIRETADDLRSPPKMTPNKAATIIAAHYKGYRVRKVMNDTIDDLFYNCAVKIQSVWRGYRVRRWIRSTLDKIRLEEESRGEVCDDMPDAEDLMPSMDLSHFNEEDVDKMWDDIKLPPTARPNSSRFVQELRKKTSMPTQGPLVTAHAPVSNQFKSAWTSDRIVSQRSDLQSPRPLSSMSKRTETIFDMNSYRSSSIQDGRRSSVPLAPLHNEKMTKKKEEIMQEWGFHNEKCAALMLERAKKLKYNSEKKKRISQMDPRQRLILMRRLQTEGPPVSVRNTNRGQRGGKVSGRIDYFREYSVEEIRERGKALEKMQKAAIDNHATVSRTYEWIFDSRLSSGGNKPASYQPPMSSHSTTTSLQQSANQRVTLPTITTPPRSSNWMAPKGPSLDEFIPSKGRTHNTYTRPTNKTLPPISTLNLDKPPSS